MQKKIIVSKPVGFMILAWVVGLFLAVWISMMAAQASAQSSFSYQALAFLGDRAPGGGVGCATQRFRTRRDQQPR